MLTKLRFLLIMLLLSAFFSTNASEIENNPPNSYQTLLDFFTEWRTFEKPPLVNGVPDYRKETIAKRHSALKQLQARLATIDTTGWTIPHRVDFHIIEAEMHGMDFNIRVLQPWVRDPAYYQSIWTYQSDTPDHEGPTNHAVIELWQYDFPLDKASEKKLEKEIKTISPLIEQARINLTGNAKELWIGGIINIRDQAANLRSLQDQTQKNGRGLKKAIKKAIESTDAFVAWLEKESANKTGPSGIGKEHYTWHLRHVHMVPMSWEEEVYLLERELARAHTSLRLEEQRNAHLPPLVAASSKEEYDQRAMESIDRYLNFLDKKEILVIRDYMGPVLAEHKGPYIPEEKRNFFRKAMHYDTNTLNTHFYHWWDLARMEVLPHESPVRRYPLLYNIWDSRAEGQATGFEEMVLHAGLYDDNPRVREIVWIMLAQRAARGLGSLYAHANIKTMKEARDFHVKWTPRGWMREDLDLLGFEQLLYLRQPGYGTSYITGKILVEQLMAERSNQLGDKFKLKDFFEDMDNIGLIPVSLIRWEMTGNADHVEEIVNQ
ncbi:MAG: DUF885 family protein [Calditrichota bacterium]